MDKTTFLAVVSFLLALGGCSTSLRPASGSGSDAAVARAEPPPPAPIAEEASPPFEPAPAPRVIVTDPGAPDPLGPTATGERAVRMLPPVVGTVPQAHVLPGRGCCPPAGTCCPPPSCPPCPRPCPLYGGASAEFSPGTGGGLHLGYVLHRDRCAEWSWEAGLSYHDLWVEAVDEGQTGKSMQVRLGFKASLTPDSRAHLVGRAGLTYYQITGEGVDKEWIDIPPGDFVGVYGSVGYEWDLSCHFTTGPEVGVSVVTEVEDFGVEFVPFARWNFILRL
jgi:hypothetical protein